MKIVSTQCRRHAEELGWYLRLADKLYSSCDGQNTLSSTLKKHSPSRRAIINKQGGKPTRRNRHLVDPANSSDSSIYVNSEAYTLWSKQTVGLFHLTRIDSSTFSGWSQSNIVLTDRVLSLLELHKPTHVEALFPKKLIVYRSIKSRFAHLSSHFASRGGNIRSLLCWMHRENTYTKETAAKLQNQSSTEYSYSLLQNTRTVGAVAKQPSSSVLPFACICSKVNFRMSPACAGRVVVTNLPRMSDVRISNPFIAIGYALLMSSNTSRTRVHRFSPSVKTIARGQVTIV
ncbi:hypothetical protein T265_05186 [Opisthorchis viverrini]|uniref:Uncharacterized protein n=1 Tax=Opisthorchis viverrini TaxID=6198 RepID=A0A075AFJ7_OPIVI|nr:hypothetical protein T265_05186 [Opisthorchis viverrini]KER27824.1 hypothetical protein T265_05186 [Opisthorchis viverrini]